MKQKTKDNLIYLGVGLAIVAVFTTYVFYTERKTGTIQEIPKPVLWGIFSTPGIVALMLEQSWEYRRRRGLWVALIAAASINVLAVWAVYSYGWDPPLIVWSTVTGLVMMVLFIVAKTVVTR